MWSLLFVPLFCVTLLKTGLATELAERARELEAAEPPGGCKHGKYIEATDKCACDAGWTTSGITSTVNFVLGNCEQYVCESDASCQAVLGIPSATCPIKGWNCYCGWSRFGFENAEGRCMGFMYTFSVWTTLRIRQLVECLWKVLLVLALAAIPFGRKRSICDHHRPSLWNSLRACVGHYHECRGECVMSSEYTLDSFKDDLAWTIFVLDMGIWLYLFLALSYLMLMFIWTLILWMLVIFLLVVASISLLCIACCHGLTSGNCDFNFHDCCGGDSNAADGAQADNVGSMDWCECCDCMGGSAGVDTTDAFYWAGPFPHDPFLFSCGDGQDCETECPSCRLCLKPFACLLYILPHLPENAWGGLCGYLIFGTHHLTPEERLYTGGNPVIEFFRMGWRRPADLHLDSNWREHVRRYLQEEDIRSPSSPETSRSPHGTQLRHGFSPLDVEEPRVLNLRRDVVAVGHARAKLIHRPFDKELDRCFPSSFEDYVANKCWICQESREVWDLWLSCRHLFCKECSTEMLSRRMPCPLCRVASGVVLRGEAWQPDVNVNDRSLVASARGFDGM